MDEPQKIFFETKEDSNRRRIEESLASSPHDRFKFFLHLCAEMQSFNEGRVHPNKRKNNFILEK